MVTIYTISPTSKTITVPCIVEKADGTKEYQDKYIEVSTLSGYVKIYFWLKYTFEQNNYTYWLKSCELYGECTGANTPNNTAYIDIGKPDSSPFSKAFDTTNVFSDFSTRNLAFFYASAFSYGGMYLKDIYVGSSYSEEDGKKIGEFKLKSGATLNSSYNCYWANSPNDLTKTAYLDFDIKHTSSISQPCYNCIIGKTLDLNTVQFKFEHLLRTITLDISPFTVLRKNGIVTTDKVIKCYYGETTPTITGVYTCDKNSKTGTVTCYFKYTKSGSSVDEGQAADTESISGTETYTFTGWNNLPTESTITKDYTCTTNYDTSRISLDTFILPTPYSSIVLDPGYSWDGYWYWDANAAKNKKSTERFGSYGQNCKCTNNADNWTKYFWATWIKKEPRTVELYNSEGSLIGSGTITVGESTISGLTIEPITWGDTTDFIVGYYPYDYDDPRVFKYDGTKCTGNDYWDDDGKWAYDADCKLKAKQVPIGGLKLVFHPPADPTCPWSDYEYYGLRTQEEFGSRANPPSVHWSGKVFVKWVNTNNNEVANQKSKYTMHKTSEGYTNPPWVHTMAFWAEYIDSHAGIYVYSEDKWHLVDDIYIYTNGSWQRSGGGWKLYTDSNWKDGTYTK